MRHSSVVKIGRNKIETDSVPVFPLAVVHSQFGALQHFLIGVFGMRHSLSRNREVLLLPASGRVGGTVEV